ncbi:hypothetical protein WMY93_028110 [Mugilogobius chulae]|uniref:Cytochrome c oxidase subunit 7A1, mitochondrial n=1 Tax=Mugilogobius chulae TaxID=88201 RepID=A0AAW0MZ86_9GOBI
MVLFYTDLWCVPMVWAVDLVEAEPVTAARSHKKAYIYHDITQYFVPVVLSRGFSRSTRSLKNRVPDAQKVFQEDNGLPVHIKGGTVDVVMYRATMTLTLGGTCYSIYWLLKASLPQNKP